MLAITALNFGMAHAGPLGPLDPQIFARAEDQERARSLTKACTEDDVGHGCYRHDGHALRELPCSYHIDASTIGSRPTDQCYKMDAPRRYRGVWIDEFEGQAFVPEGARQPEWPSDDPKSQGWRERAERARLGRIWFDASRIDLDRKAHPRGGKRLIEFIGRKTMYPGAYGHFGMSGHEIIADRVITLQECASTGACSW